MNPFVVWVVVVGRKINMNQPTTIMGNYSATKIVGMKLMSGGILSRQRTRPLGHTPRTDEASTGGLSMTITRREALENLRFDAKEFGKILQGRTVFKEHTDIDIADPNYNEESISKLVDALDEFERWICQEITRELQIENDLLPDEGNPGVPIGG